MNKTRHPVGLVLVLLSLVLNFISVVLYVQQPDTFAAFTVLPIWLWGALGLLLSLASYFLFRSPLSLFTSTMWFLVILVLSDEAPGLVRFGQTTPEDGRAAPYLNRQPLRVITCNWSSDSRPIGPAIAPWEPDIVFIQEMPHPYLIKQLADTLYGNTGDYRYDENHACGVVLRGRIKKALLEPQYRSQYLTARLPNGNLIELANIHLQPASTNLSLWSPSCWKEHRQNRMRRRSELQFALAFLNEYTPFPNRPTLIAGDFNAPATDGASDVLARDFTDTFEAVGTGWGNTYHRRFPLLRLDQIHASHHFLPLRSRAVTIEESEHRMVVSDLLLE
ncbi:endonuclease/exonuclease/phosphatase family protein [Roseibacillus persicicus]|uniref:endonuclease/exonuclease/phosphatase family protein n=1 Tax=Roseibacillus persicicus TaxID=454148 RepID=UPI00398AF03D